jgi:hypothetical protein
MKVIRTAMCLLVLVFATISCGGGGSGPESSFDLCSDRCDLLNDCFGDDDVGCKSFCAFLDDTGYDNNSGCEEADVAFNECFLDLSCNQIRGPEFTFSCIDEFDAFDAACQGAEQP